MSTRISIHLTRIAQALLIAALCVILAAGAFADKNDNSRDGGSRGRGARHQDSSGAPRNHQSDSPRGSSAYQTGGRTSTDKPADSSRRTDKAPSVDRPANGNAQTDRPARTDRPAYGGQTNRPTPIDRPAYGRTDRPAPVIVDRRGDENRDSRKPASIYLPRGNGQNTHNDRPVIVDRGNQHPTRPEVYAPKQRVDIHIDNHRSYTPPTFRGGSYYYSGRPSNRSYHYGSWVFDYSDNDFCRPSIYFHYGFFPYVRVSRVIVEPYVVVGYHGGPVVITGGYYLSKHANTGLDNALSDIRTAWQDGRLDLVTSHVSNARKIAVLLDGKYDYSIEPDDYTKMTSDALDEIKTVSFTWESVRERTDGDYIAFGKHVYNDASGTTQTVYVSYTLAKIGGEYYIVEVGSSTSPLS